MKFKKLALGLMAVLVMGAAAAWFSLDKEARGVLATLPSS